MADRPPYLLCVDDDTLVLNLLREHFTRLGFIVLTATNGVDACVQVRRWRPRAAIVDLMLPGLGGIGTLSRIRALNPGMAVIVLSDNDDMLSLATMAGLSVTGAFSKPVDLELVSETLARAGIGSPLAQERPQRARAMVVDDEGDFRDLIAEHLTERGFEVESLGDAEVAIQRITKFQPHVVLLDVMMAPVDGLEALARIKALRPETCVIMTTAVDDLETVHGAMALGAADYVTKPMRLEYLASVLETHLWSRFSDRWIPAT